MKYMILTHASQRDYDAMSGKPTDRTVWSAADFAATQIEEGPAGTRFTLLEKGHPAGRMSTPLVGTHNLRNTLGAIAIVRGLGLSAGEISRALPGFSGVRRRL